MKTPSYYAVIPAPIRYHETLTANAKLMYGEIAALSEREGFCWATNAYFADLYKVTPQTISGWIRELVAAGFVSVEVVESRGNERRLWTVQTFGGLPKNQKRSSGKSGEGSSGFSDPTNIEEQDKDEREKRTDGFALDVEVRKSNLETEVIKEWNNLPHPIGQVKMMTEKRRKSLNARAKEPGWINHWRDAMRKIAESPFLTGKNDRGWTATLDWFLKPESVTKLAEGQYADKTLKPKDDPDFWKKHV